MKGWAQERGPNGRQETRLIGLIGGLGPAATIHYYEGLHAACRERGVRLRLVVNNADLDLVLDAAGRGDVEALAAHLASRSAELESAGAAMLAIAALTPHLCLPLLTARVVRPIVDPVTPLRREMERQGFQRVALLGTRTVMASALFGRLSDKAIDIPEETRDRVHGLYVTIVRAGRASRTVSHELGAIAARLRMELDVDAVVLAGTELSLAPAVVWSGTPIIDCASLHMAAIMAAAVG